MTDDFESRRVRELAHELADVTGEPVTHAVEVALREAIARRRRPGPDERALLDRIAQHCAQLPVRDDRTPEEIIGYDDAGLPR